MDQGQHPGMQADCISKQNFVNPVKENPTVEQHLEAQIQDTLETLIKLVAHKKSFSPENLAMNLQSFRQKYTIEQWDIRNYPF